MVNGTCALQLALSLAGVKKNDEVLVPALTFVATANAVIHAGGIPNFIDSEIETLGICPIKLEKYLCKIAIIKNNSCFNKITGRKIAAIVPVHVFGHPVKLKKLLVISKKFKIKMVEDASESLGSFYKKKHTGTFGLLGVLSFNGNKIITCGGGGAILTNNSSLAKKAQHLSTTAKVKHPWEYVHNDIGYNFRMPNVNAAILLAQLEQIDRKLKIKKKIFKRYDDALNILKVQNYFQSPNLSK